MKNTSETVKCKHTPTPYRSVECQAFDGVGCAYDIEVDGQTVAHVYPAENMEANAQFIVTACNAHAVLLDACQSAFDMLSSPKFKAWRDENCKSEENWAMVSAMNLRQVELAEAISLATTT